MRKNLMYFFGAIAFIGGGTVFSGCSDSGDDKDYSMPINIELTRGESDAVNSVNAFTFDLLKAYDARFSEEKPNYVMSPQSAAWCLAMVANGAPEGSESFREIAGALHLGDGATLQDVNAYSQKMTEAITAKHGNADVRVANALFYRDEIGIKDSYVDLMKSFYDAEAFENPTNKIIDSWIDKKTGGLIKNFAQKNNLDEDYFGVINTLYFAGKWKHKFDSANTKERKFRNADGTISMVRSMSDRVGCYVAENDVCYLLRLDFQNEAFSFYGLIPLEYTTLTDVIHHLNPDSWKELTQDFIESGYLDLMLPELNLGSDVDFFEVVQDMGVEKIFTNESDLTEISELPLSITKYVQSSVINLDDGGVTFSSSVAAGIYITSAGPGKYFYLDEPFLFFITENSTGAILFLGKVSQL